MAKEKNKTNKKAMPDSSVLEGVPAHNPQEEYAKKDAIIKKNRGAKS